MWAAAWSPVIRSAEFIFHTGSMGHHENSKRGIRGLPSNAEAKNSKLALIVVSVICAAGLALLGYLWFANGKSGDGGGETASTNEPKKMKKKR